MDKREMGCVCQELADCFTTSSAAAYAGVSTQTIHSWIVTSRLKVIQTPLGALIPPQVLHQWLAERAAVQAQHAAERAAVAARWVERQQQSEAAGRPVFTLPESRARQSASRRAWWAARKASLVAAVEASGNGHTNGVSRG